MNFDWWNIGALAFVGIVWLLVLTWVSRYARMRGYQRGYKAGLHDGLPSIGECGNCGFTTSPGTLFEISEQVMGHVQECAGPRRDIV
jgi:hypothetical protein